MTESRLPCIWRCAECGGGVHEDEALHWKPSDDIVCPRCFDNLTDTHKQEDSE